MTCTVCKQSGHNARSCKMKNTHVKPLKVKQNNKMESNIGPNMESNIGLNMESNMGPTFVNQVFRKDILTNMLLNKTVLGKDLFELIMSDNNTSPNASRKGGLFEAIAEIMILLKCVNGINYTEIMEGDLSASHKISNCKMMLNKKILQGGNVSDITIKEGECLIAFSCKYNKDKISKKKTDANDLESTLKRHTSNYKVGLFVKDKNNISTSKKNDIHKEAVNVIEANKLIFDEKDLIIALDTFRNKFVGNTLGINEFIDDIINADYLLSSRKQLVLKLHQKMTEIKFVKSYLLNKRKMWCIAHKPRSGKSITILTICKYLLENGLNKILIMTSVPATIDSFVEDLEKYVDFKHINYKRQENFETIDEQFKGIVFCSVQYLKIDGKTAKKDALKQIGFQLIVTDECHLGGSTDKTKSEILDIDSSNIIEDIRKGIRLSIFASGTADKTIKYYGIKSTEVFEWEIIDEGHMKKLINKNEEIIDFMVRRHGHEFIECLENTTLNHDYSIHPAQVLMKHSIPDELIKQITEYNAKHGTNYGYNCASLFALRQFMNSKGEKEYAEEFDLCKDSDGEEILKGLFECIISKDPMKKDTIMKCIETTQTSYSSRKSSIVKPLLFIVYLPTHTGNNTIAALQRTFKQFLNNNGLWSDYNIEYSNSSDNSSYINEKEYNNEIAGYMTVAKRENKRGCILLLGNKGSVGITYNDCDVTISLDDGHCLDNQKQRFSRALTDAPGKTIGINVDMNIQRTYLYMNDMIHKHRKSTKTTMTNAEIMHYLYEHNIFLFNPHQFNNGKCTIHEIVSYYESEAENILREIDDTQILENIECDDTMRDLIQIDYQKSIVAKRVNKELEGEQQDCPKGDKKKIEISGPEGVVPEGGVPEGVPEGELTPEETDILINQTYELCKGFLFPLLSLVSRSSKIKDFKELFITEKIRDFLYLLLTYKIDQLNKDKYILIINIMNNIIDNNIEIVNNIREIYHLASPERLRELIAKHFIPTQEEKKGHAEVPTPVKLVDEMLYTMPVDFWKTPQTVFEPCCGKGNFVLGIFDRFYNGLAEMYPNVIERCRIIMTECIYYSDLTALNVFITTEIMKCHVQIKCGLKDLDYKFNTYTGDTLSIDINTVWNIKCFNAVIGNPPYNKNLYKKFTEFCINICNVLLFVIPSTFTIGVSHAKFIELLKTNGLQKVIYLDKKNWGGEIDIDTLYILCSNGYIDKISVNSVLIERQDRLFNMDNTYSQIINKIKRFNKLQLHKGRNETLNHNNPIETENIKFIESAEHKHKLLSRLNGGKGEQIYYTNKYQEEQIAGHKILFPRGTGSYNSISNLKKINKPIVYSKITDETVLLSTGIVYFKCNSLNEAKFIQWYLMFSKFCRFMFIKENKFSELTKGFVNIIPCIEYDENSTISSDEYVYTYFNLSEKEIKMIEDI